jgi:acyl-CoA synthetase (AMP-forming)/AMP-acid ligase II
MSEPRGALLLWDAFEAAAGAHRDAVAITDGTSSVNYEQLLERAAACRNRLRESESGRRALDRGGAVIGLVAADAESTIAWMLAGLAAGATVAPIAPDGPDRDDQLRLLQPDVTVTCTGDGIIGPLVLFGRVVRNAQRPPAGMILCTAGTTGTPKAVAHSHATLGHAVRRLQLFRSESAGVAERVPADDRELAEDLLAAAAAPALGLRYLSVLPVTTTAGLTVALQALLAGETLVLPRSTDAAGLLDAFASAGVTNASLPPLLAQLVLRAARRPGARRPQQLLFVGIGGGSVPPAVPAELEAALGCPVAIGYGATEVGGALTMGRMADSAEVRHQTAGGALPGVDLRVDAGTHELRVRCASIAAGYVQPTGELLPLGEEYATGDLAVLRDDGALELHGRVDALIVRGGRNIDPTRIERTLENHPAVRRAGAFGVANRAIAGEQDIWTLVELEQVVGEIELRRHCTHSLGPSFTPRRIIAVDALPVTADGAVRRHELARLASVPTHPETSSA